MFSIHDGRKVISDFPLIVGNYRVLHFDEEPILFSGTNHYGNKIVGSLVDSDDAGKFVRYFHVILDSKSYFQFVHQKITYLEILRTSGSFYVVDRTYTDEISAVYLTNLDEIPSQYLPLEDSYCPPLGVDFGLEFIVGLKGKLANMNAALPREISTIQNTFSNILTSSAQILKGLAVVPRVHQLAYTDGSFRLNFNIGLDTKKEIELFVAKDDDIASFLNHILEYCITNLPDEVDLIYGSEDFSAQFSKIRDEIDNIYKSAFTKPPDDMIDILKTGVFNAVSGLQQISENIGTNFTEIELLNRSRDIEIPIGFIDSHFKTQVEKTLERIEEFQGEITIDEEPQTYEICIYHLNTETRTGNAFIYNVDSETEMSRPRIRILGDQPLDQTRYTESLYMNKWIKVQGKAKRIEDKFRNIEITYDE